VGVAVVPLGAEEDRGCGSGDEGQLQGGKRERHAGGSTQEPVTPGL
jgi:hypothetical protein